VPLYHYKATTPEGQVREGEMEGADRKAIVASIQRAGHIPIRVAPAARRLGLRLGGGLRWRRGITPAHAAALAQELASLLQAGLPLDRALDIAAEVAHDAHSEELIGRLREAVETGGALSDAMENEPAVFSALHVSMVRAAEASGNLGAGLARLADYLERSRALRERVVNALIYPAVLTGIAGISLLIVLAYVVPKITVLFSDAGAALPLPTRIVIGASELFHGYWWLLLAAGVGVALYLRRSFARPSSRYRWDRRMLRTPVLGDLVRKLETARFARSMGTLIVNGVPVLNALSIARSTLSNRVLAQALAAAAETLKAGRGLAEPLVAEGLFPPLAVQLVRVGEETGRLGEMLLRVADIYDRETTTAMQRLLGLLEPALIVFLGVVIGGIIMSILMAIVSVNDLPL
jgi:general secretion pathway protein F